MELSFPELQEEYTSPDSFHSSSSARDNDYPSEDRTSSDDDEYPYFAYRYDDYESIDWSYTTSETYNFPRPLNVYHNTYRLMDSNPLWANLPVYGADVEDWKTISTYYDNWEQEHYELFQ